MKIKKVIEESLSTNLYSIFFYDDKIYIILYLYKILRGDIVENAKWTTIKVILINMLFQTFGLGIITFIVYKIIKEIYGIDLLSLMQGILKPIRLELIVLSVSLIIIREFYKRYRFHQSLDHLYSISRDFENPKAVFEWSIVYINGEIDLLKLKVDILKSFSPIPIIVLFIGGVFEKSKIIDLNTYGIASLILILLYFGWLMTIFSEFSTLRRKLAYYEQHLIMVENKNLFDKKLRNPRDFSGKYAIYEDNKIK